MAKFKTPTQFEMAGITFNVIKKPDLVKLGLHGMARYDDNEIWVEEKPLNEDHQGITFYHELFHILFNTVGREDLRNDEALVDLLGSLMWQFEKTKAY